MTAHKYQIVLFHEEAFHRSSSNYLLGEPIDTETAQKLLKAFENTPIPHRFCLGSLDIHTSYRNHITRPNTHNNNYNTYFGLSVNFNQHIGCPCAPHINNYSPYCKVSDCAHNIATGKCRDEFMQKTVGAILYPQHYAKNKQK